MSKPLRILGFIFFLSVFSFQALYLAKTNSTVSDEVAHITAGYTYLKFQTLKLNMEHPPLVKELSALPLILMNLKFPLDHDAWKGDGEQWMLGRLFLYGLGNPAENVIFAARAALLPIAWLLGFFIYRWTKKLFGTAAAFFALFLYSLLPEFLIHSSLVTTDFALTAFFFGCFWKLDCYADSGKLRDLLLAALLGGLAISSKYSAALLLPLFYGAAFFLVKEGKAKNLPARIPLWFLAPLFAFIVSQRHAFYIVSAPLIFVSLQYLLPKWRPLQNERLQSFFVLSFILIGISLAVIALVYFEPLNWFHTFRPFKRFFRGWTIFRDHARFGDHPSFLLGQVSQTGFKYYYPVALFFKLPIAFSVLSLTGLIFIARKKPLTKFTAAFLLIPPVFYFAVSCLMNKVNIGVRHVLPIYPFLAVLAGCGFQALWNGKPKLLGRSFAAGLGLWFAVSCFRVFPNSLSYFNEFAAFAGGPEKILGDSNIGWGQDLKRLAHYLRENGIQSINGSLYFNFPEELHYYGISLNPDTAGLKNGQPGVYVLDSYSYQSMLRDPDYSVLKTIKPSKKIGGSVLVFRV